MTQIIQLYTTAGCHLCEQAAAMFAYLTANDLQTKEQFSLNLVEIAEDDVLLETYGIRIPVLAKSNDLGTGVNSDQELGWPFELEELKAWLLAG